LGDVKDGEDYQSRERDHGHVRETQGAGITNIGGGAPEVKEVREDHGNISSGLARSILEQNEPKRDDAAQDGGEDEEDERVAGAEEGADGGE